MSQLQLGSGARLSAWRWTSIVLEMRVEFKRLATRIENNEEPVEARESLRKLIQQSLHADMSADEADLLCETFRGVEALAMQEVEPQARTKQVLSADMSRSSPSGSTDWAACSLLSLMQRIRLKLLVHARPSICCFASSQARVGLLARTTLHYRVCLLRGTGCSTSSRLHCSLSSVKSQLATTKRPSPSSHPVQTPPTPCLSSSSCSSLYSPYRLRRRHPPSRPDQTWPDWPCASYVRQS